MAQVPLLASSIEPYHDRLAEAIERVARSGAYILGPEVEAFESEFASFLGVEHCVGVGNGTDALAIALRALGVGPGSYRQCRFLAGAPDTVWPAFQGGPAAIVSEPYAYRHGLAVADVRLVPAGAIPRTTSGKLARRACRDAYLGGEF